MTDKENETLLNGATRKMAKTYIVVLSCVYPSCNARLDMLLGHPITLNVVLAWFVDHCNTLPRNHLKILIQLCSKWTWVMPHTAPSPYAIMPSPRSGTSRRKSTRRLSASQSRISYCFFLIEHESLAPHQQQLPLSHLRTNTPWHLMASKMVPKSDA